MSTAAQRARLAAQLQYAPQQQALSLLLQQAVASYQQGVQASRSSASGVARSATAAVKPVQQDYQRAAQQAQVAHQGVTAQLGGLGAAANPYKASAASEMGLADQLRAREQAAATTELRDRAVQAQQGAAYDARALHGQLLSDVSKIGGQMQTVSGEQGAAQSKLYMDLLDQAARDQRAQAGLNETVRHNHATEQNASRGKAPGGAKLLPQSLQNRTFDQVDQAIGYIKQLEGAGLSSGEVRQVLLNGRKTPVQTVYNPKTRKAVIDPKTGLKQTTGGTQIPAFKSKLVVNAAYDIAKLGYLSPTNIKRLHNAGVLIRGRYKTQAPPKGDVGAAVGGVQPSGF